SHTVVSPLSLHDALPIYWHTPCCRVVRRSHWLTDTASTTKTIAVSWSARFFAAGEPPRCCGGTTSSRLPPSFIPTSPSLQPSNTDRKSTRLNSSHVSISY